MARQVGLKDIHFAPLTKDDATGVTYGTPVKIANAISAKIAKKYNSEKTYSDDTVEEVLSNLESVDVEFEVGGLPLTSRALIQGATIVKGTLIENKDDIAPEGAFLFRSKKSNGKYRYVALLKGKFEPTDDDYGTEEDKPKGQTNKVKGTFYSRAFDGNHQFTADEDETGVVQATLDAWFTAVPTEPTEA